MWCKFCETQTYERSDCLAAKLPSVMWNFSGFALMRLDDCFYWLLEYNVKRSCICVFCKGVKFEIQIRGTCLSLFYYILGILMFFQSYGCFLFYWKILKDSSSFLWQYCYIFFHITKMYLWTRVRILLQEL